MAREASDGEGEVSLRSTIAFATNTHLTLPLRPLAGGEGFAGRIEREFHATGSCAKVVVGGTR